MTYLLHRIRESNGFIAKRVFYKAVLVATLIYGRVGYKGNRIILLWGGDDGDDK